MSPKFAAKKIVITALILGPLLGGGDPAQAQLAVIDVGAITQLILEVQQLQQALQVAQQTLTQAQQAYAAITGGRGMELLLAGINRNYLPTNWAQLLGAENGGGGVLGGDIAATIQRNALLTP